MCALNVGIVGSTGYAGTELLRLLLAHPEVVLKAVVSRSQMGRRVDAVFPSFQGFTDLVFEGFDAEKLAGLDVVFLATPHEATASLAETLDAAGAKRIIDLSRDHRHVAGWHYGQVDFGEPLGGVNRISVPGCFATAITMALAPFVREGLLDGPVHCVAATGSTGAGATPSSTTHHPERFANLKGYKVLQHQHEPEITTFLKGIGPFERLDFVPLSAPVDRGILATCFLPMPRPWSTGAIGAFLNDVYAPHPLVRVREHSPELRQVRGTGLCDLAGFSNGEQAVVMCAIDNLGKGAAAHAVQCMNLAARWKVDLGLRQPAVLP